MKQKYPKNKLYWRLFLETLYLHLKYSKKKDNLAILVAKAEDNEKYPALINKNVNILLFYLTKIDRTIANRLYKSIDLTTRCMTMNDMLTRRGLHAKFYIKDGQPFMLYNQYFLTGITPNMPNLKYLSFQNNATK